MKSSKWGLARFILDVIIVVCCVLWLIVKLWPTEDAQAGLKLTNDPDEYEYTDWDGNKGYAQYCHDLYFMHCETADGYTTTVKNYKHVK